MYMYVYVVICNLGALQPSGNSRGFDFSFSKSLLEVSQSGDKQLVKPLFDPAFCFLPGTAVIPTILVQNKREKDKKQCLSDDPRTVMVKKENYYQEFKGHTKWLSLISSHLYVFLV